MNIDNIETGMRGDSDWESFLWLFNQYKKGEKITRGFDWLYPYGWLMTLNDQIIRLLDDMEKRNKFYNIYNVRFSQYVRHKYLTPKNKNAPPCNNKTEGDNDYGCYLNPLEPPEFAECIDYDNWWQEYENDICFPTYSKEKQTINNVH